MRAIAAALASVSAKPGLASLARAQNNATASEPARSAAQAALGGGSESCPNRTGVSPGTASGSRLVASTATSGQWVNRW